MTLSPDTQSPRAEFLARFSSVYESSPWAAEDAYKVLGRVDIALETITDTMKNCVDAASSDVKMQLLNLHPELAGKLAQAGNLTQESLSEQAAAGLNNCTAKELGLFQTLNKTYREKFNFPFIVAVAGLTRFDIIETFQTRITHTIDAEFREAMKQVHIIAAHRLKSLYAKGRS